MKAVIQAGGKGTRISSITGDTIPKPMLEISGYPILYYQIMNLKKYGITDIILVVGHLGNVIKKYFKNGSNLGVNINYFEENPNNPLGTAGSLYYLKNQIDDDFVFLLADVFIDIDFNKLINYHKEKKALITLMTHPNSHPYDSDLIVTNGNNAILGFDLKTNDRTTYDYNNLVNSGVMIFNNKVLELLKEEKNYNYEKDIVIPLIKTGKVYSYKSTEYAKDMGTPERYETVQKDYENGICHQKNLSNSQKCIFLDRDGTINEHIGFLRKKEELVLIKNSLEAIKLINNSGYLCIVVTNQPIIARGDSTTEELNNIHKRLETLLGKGGAYVDDIYFCPHHPDKGFGGEIVELKIECNCRKPKTGMIEKAVRDYNIDLSQSYIIGDSTLDIQLAKNANIPSFLLKTGQAGLDKKYEVTPSYESENLYEAVKLILRKEK